MSRGILSKIFYTPVHNPEGVSCIEVDDERDLEIINNFVKGIVPKKLKKPDAGEPRFCDNLRDNILEVMNKGLDLESEDVRKFFEKLSMYMYGRAKERHKYWCLILTEHYFFIYHFAPNTAVSFENNNVVEFIKYLDDASILKFIFRLKGEHVSTYFEELSDDEDLQHANYVHGFYDKNKTKGMMRVMGKEPEYEFKGELRIRVKKSEKTDIVVESFLEDLENISSSVELDFEKQMATIKIEEAPITELSVGGKKYDVKTGVNRITYERLGVGEFMELYKFRKNKYELEKKDSSSETGNDRVFEEFKGYVVLGDDRVNKPMKDFPGKEETIYILGESVDKRDDLIRDAAEAIRNNFNVAFVELNGFSVSYSEVTAGDFFVFARLKSKDDKNVSNILKGLESISRMIEEVGAASPLGRTLQYVGLLVLCGALKSKGFRDKLYKIGKKALSDYYMNTLGEKNIELKEIDKLGIEFKAGIREDKRGFFDSSPKGFSKKILEKFNGKENNTVVFFVGFNEDTRDFSPIPLSRIRNEFHEDLKKYLCDDEILKECSFDGGVNALQSETVPISKDKGVLIIVLQKR